MTRDQSMPGAFTSALSVSNWLAPVATMMLMRSLRASAWRIASAPWAAAASPMAGASL